MSYAQEVIAPIDFKFHRSLRYARIVLDLSIERSAELRSTGAKRAMQRKA